MQFDIALTFAQAQRPPGVQIDPLRDFATYCAKGFKVHTPYVRQTEGAEEAHLLTWETRRAKYGEVGRSKPLVYQHSDATKAKLSAARRRRPALTHCKRGHAFAEHSYFNGRQRVCRKCMAAHSAAWRRRQGAS